MIHLSRKHSIVLAIGLIGVFFLGMWALSRKSKKPPSIPPVTLTAAATPTISNTARDGAQFLLNEFHRSETKNGRKVWEIKAEKGEYFPDKQMAEVFSANVWLFRDNGEEVFLQSPQAQLSFDGAALARAFFPTTVHVVNNNEVTIDTSIATYDKIAGTVSSDQSVTVSSALIDIRGNRFIAHIDQNSIVISGGVTTLIKPQEKKR